ncbi:MAG: hypothetical protein ACYST5_16730, partial [Planctomycetota bacterium]
CFATVVFHDKLLKKGQHSFRFRSIYTRSPQPLHAFTTTKSGLSVRDSEESTTMKLDIESQFETEIVAGIGQNGV